MPRGLTVHDEGTEVCRFCLQLFHLEDGLWCGRCDGPVCPLCAVWSAPAREVSCPRCHASPVEEE